MNLTDNAVGSTGTELLLDFIPIIVIVILIIKKAVSKGGAKKEKSPRMSRRKRKKLELSAAQGTEQPQDRNEGGTAE